MQPLQLTLVTAFAAPAVALLVTAGSPCSQYCGNVLSSTTAADMTCSDSAYTGSAAGIVFESCINCELKSNYSSNGQTDVQWLIYNIRYALSYCLYGYPNNTNIVDTPCITNTACGPLSSAISFNNLSTAAGAYDFCQSWLEDQVPKCTTCLSAGQMDFMENYITILDAACTQMPAVGSTLSLEGSPFSTVPMNVTTPTPTAAYTFHRNNSPISLGGKVGITIGGIVLILFVAGLAIVCNGRRRRRAYLKRLETRYGKSVWPSPANGFNPHDSFSTPLSQKPLRGWDDQSPVSVMTDSGSIGRYFSPYNSQYNSPVSALDSMNHQPWLMADAMAAGVGAGAAVGSSGAGTGGSNPAQQPGWPGFTQEDMDRMAREYNAAQHVGLALGGTDPSLHSKASNASMEAGPQDEAAASGYPAHPQAAFYPVPVHGPGSTSPSGSEQGKGKAPIAHEESYELHEIDSNGVPTRASAATQAPILRQPSPNRGSMQYQP